MEREREREVIQNSEFFRFIFFIASLFVFFLSKITWKTPPCFCMKRLTVERAAAATQSFTVLAG